MNRTLATVALAAAAVALTGCSAEVDSEPTDRAAAPDIRPSTTTTEPEPDPEPVVPAPVEPDPADVTLDEDLGATLYPLTVRMTVDGFEAVSDDALNDVGRGVCADLDAGMDAVTIGFTLIGEGATPEQAGALVGAAPVAFCPEREAEVMASFDAIG